MLDSQTMESIRKSLLLLGVLATFGIISCEQAEPTLNSANTSRKGSPLPKATVDELASGKTVYETSCVICHSKNGTGGRVFIEGKTLNVEDLTADKIRKMTDERMILYIMNGVEDEGMPAFKDKLSEGEMRDRVKFIRTEIHKTKGHSNKRSV